MKEYFKNVLCGIYSLFVHASVVCVGFLTTLIYMFIPQTSGWVSIFLFVCGVLFMTLTLLGLWTMGLLARGKIQLIGSDKGVEKTDE